MSKQIDYKIIKELGFSEIHEEDPIFENEFGYPYKIFEKRLTKHILIDWDQTTRICTLLRLKKDHIKSEYTIKNEEELMNIIKFFS